jgi:hypothetical protein
MGFAGKALTRPVTGAAKNSINTNPCRFGGFETKNKSDCSRATTGAQARIDGTI